MLCGSRPAAHQLGGGRNASQPRRLHRWRQVQCHYLLHRPLNLPPLTLLVVSANAGPNTGTGHDLHAMHTTPLSAKWSPRVQIALDGEVVYGEAMVSSEHITGEALPRQFQRGDTVPAGALNHDGVLVVKVQRPSADSTPARIARLTAEAQVGLGGLACSGWQVPAPLRPLPELGLEALEEVRWTVQALAGHLWHSLSLCALPASFHRHG